MNDRLVAIENGPGRYPSAPPFPPGAAYPELAHVASPGAAPNPTYALVRQALCSLGFDLENYASPGWNPLRELVRPGDTVLLKPNLIRESHLLRAAEWSQIVTHGAVIRPLVDYLLLATRGDVRIVIADGPQTDSDFDRICERNGLFALQEHYQASGHPIELLDLRRDRWFERGGVLYRRIPLAGDPAGYTALDLGAESEFADYALNGRFYGADYDMEETHRYHAAGRHSYVLCRTALDADVIINLPKLKTHKKVGVTLALKNLVGVNGYRNCLPHHTVGTPPEGGDEFSAADLAHRAQSRAIVAFKRLLVRRHGTAGAWARLVKRVGAAAFGSTERVVRSGNWYGNDTLWRTVLDLNKAVFYYDGDGQARSEPRRYLAVVDGIIAGEGDGPMACDARPAGVIIAGLNPVAVDTVCATLMGFDYARVPVIRQAWSTRGKRLVEFGPRDIVCVSSSCPGVTPEGPLHALPDLGFRPHFGWRGHAERSREVA